MEVGETAKEQRYGVTKAASPMEAIQWMNYGALISRCLYIAVELNVADKIKDGHEDISGLAKVTNTEPGMLYRLMRMLAGHGVFEELPGPRFSLTPMSKVLLKDSPENFGAFIKTFHHDAISKSIVGLTDTVISGDTAFEQVMGEHWTDYMKTDRGFADGFHAAMQSSTMVSNSAIANAYDFSSCAHVVDVGGGNGALLSLILKDNENLEGTLVDLEHAIDLAREGAGGPLPRCNFVVGDFFKELPSGADTYIMRNVLHDWDDEDCVRILKNCRSAVKEAGRVLVIERLIGEANVPSQGHIADMIMMFWTGGRERTEAEFEALFDKAGLRRTRTALSDSSHHIIEAVTDT